MDLPTGTVTFLFTDIEGSTRLLQELGEAYQQVHEDQTRLMREAIAEGGGTVIRLCQLNTSSSSCAHGRTTNHPGKALFLSAGCAPIGVVASTRW
jgi:hypothetical protein